MEITIFWQTIIVITAILALCYEIPFLIHKGWIDAKPPIQSIKVDPKDVENMFKFLKGNKK